MIQCRRKLLVSLICAFAFQSQVLAAALTNVNGFVDVPGGKLHYETSGSGPAIVFLHDGMMHSETWDNQWLHFSKSHRLVRYDRRGYGKSPIAKAAYSEVDDLTAVLDRLQVSNAVFVGCSAGGKLALDFALEHPNRVTRLLLVGPVVSGLPFSKHFDERVRDAFAPLRLRGDVDGAISNWLADPWLIAPSNTSAKARFRELVSANPQNFTHPTHFARSANRPAVKYLNEIHVPTLIVVGESDMPDVHAHCGAIQAGIAGTRRIVVRGSGHFVQLERPGEVNALLEDFLTFSRNVTTTAFTNVTVIDVEAGVARPGMSVVVSSNRITEVAGAGKVSVSGAGQVIDGTGKFLMPGLWDCHVHALWEAADEFLPLYIINGITTVRDLHTTMDLQAAAQLRAEIESGKRIGPRLLYSGPIVDGADPYWAKSISVTNAEMAREEVRRLHAAGVNFIKVYEHLPREAYFAIADACKRLHLPFVGHVPQRVSSLECSDAGQLTIEHLSDVLPHCGIQPAENDKPSIDPDPLRQSRILQALASAIAGEPDTNVWPRHTWEWFKHEPGRIWREKMVARGKFSGIEFLREEKISNGMRATYRVNFATGPLLMTFDVDRDRKVQMARSEFIFDSVKAAPVLARFRTNGMWHCPTLTVHTACYRDREEAVNDPRRLLLSPEILRKSLYEQMPNASLATKRRFEQYLIAVKAMNDAGVGLLAGTDGPLGSLPGFGLHTELQLLVRAGLTPAQALRTATVNPAQCFRMEVGSVSTGLKADLLLLDANPLENITNTTRIRGVMANGRYSGRADLDRVLAERQAAAKHN